MSSLLVHNGIKVQCGECFRNDDCVRVVILWANQYGGKIRVFCGRCRKYTDIKRIGESYYADIPHDASWNFFVSKRCKEAIGE